MVNDSQHEGGFWRGKRCLITGIDGFVATHLADALVQHGSLVYGALRNRTRLISRLDLIDLRSRISLFYCDVRDFRGLLDIIAGENIDTVFHLAASAIVSTAARTPLATLEGNVTGTANVLEACRQAGVSRIVVASSDKAYGDHRSNLPYTEMHALHGLHVYDCSKSCTDLKAQTYYFQFHLPVRITRCCNIFGPGDLNFSRLVPGTIVRLLGGMKPVIHAGQGDVKREYLFVTDAVASYLAIARSISQRDEQAIPRTGEEAYSHCAYNIGPGERGVQTTQEMIGLLQSLMGTKLRPKHAPRIWETYVDLPDQFLDSGRIRGDLGWEAAVELRTGLRETITWYRDNREALKPLYEAEIAEA